MIGYFGKIPACGDFVSRGLPPPLVEAWDEWLQACMLESRRQLGDRWLTHYLTSPVWRFAISPGILGPEGLGGVMMPSVDRVGRYFPLMIAATGSPPLLDWFRKQVDWYDAIEALARASLDSGFHLATLDSAPEPWPRPASLPAPTPPDQGLRLRLSADMESKIAAAVLREYSVWWADGAPQAESAMLLFRGMPRSQGYGSMLDGT